MHTDVSGCFVAVILGLCLFVHYVCYHPHLSQRWRVTFLRQAFCCFSLQDERGVATAFSAPLNCESGSQTGRVDFENVLTESDLLQFVSGLNFLLCFATKHRNKDTRSRKARLVPLPVFSSCVFWIYGCMPCVFDWRGRMLIGQPW